MNDCKHCVHSIGCDLVSAQRFRNNGYSLGKGDFRHGLGIVCELHKIVAPTGCADYMREGGSDDVES